MNNDLKALMVLGKIPQYRVAKEYGVHEVSFSRLLRGELPPQKKQQILEIIDRLSKGGSSNG